MNTIAKIKQNPGNSFFIFFKTTSLCLSFGILALIAIYYVQPSTSTHSLSKILDRRTVSASKSPVLYEPQILIITEGMEEVWLPALEYNAIVSETHACITRISGHWITTPRYQTSPKRFCKS